MIVRNYQTQHRPYIAPVPAAPVKLPRAQSHWRDHEVAMLDEMLGRGLTYAQIARKMPWRTRCSIIGFDWRRRNA